MKRWIALVTGLLVVAAVACGSAPMAVGFTIPPDAAAQRDGEAGEGGASSGGEPGGDDGGGGFSPYLRGALAVQARGCPSCHQSADPADGVMSGQLVPVPGTRIFGKNLTPDPETGIGALTDAQILRMLRQGKDEGGNPLCDVMPRFTDMGADEEGAILVYLRALTPVRREIPDGVCPTPQDGGRADASAADAGICKDLIVPGATGPCHACVHAPCQKNGCFNGFVCDVTSATCRPPVPGCD